MNEQQYERYLNIETSGYQQGYPKMFLYHRYEPTPYEALDELFQHYELPARPVFVDIGCGKGRVPIYIHQKFGIETKGIEMDPKFFAAAVYNKEQYFSKHPNRGHDITFYPCIAEEYEVSSADNVFFFFNPFSVHIFRKVLNRILQSKELANREIHLIFFYPSPEYEQFLTKHDSTIFLSEINLSYSSNSNERIIIYKIL